MATTVPRATARRSFQLAGLLLVAAVVALSLGLYAHFHTPSGRQPFTLGFSGILQMKVWLTTAVLAFVLVQLVTALWMWGRLPGVSRTPTWVAHLHRWSGTVAFVVSLPVAFSCIWSLGFQTGSLRVVVHGVAGCAFYGAYAAKMVGLRLRGLPGWALPVLGGTVVALVIVLWLTAALWFFTRTGVPLT